MDELSKADWQKILTDANQKLNVNLMAVAIERSTAKLAREMIKNFDDADKGKTDAPPQR